MSYNTINQAGLRNLIGLLLSETHPIKLFRFSEDLEVGHHYQLVCAENQDNAIALYLNELEVSKETALTLPVELNKKDIDLLVQDFIEYVPEFDWLFVLSAISACIELEESGCAITLSPVDALVGGESTLFASEYAWDYDDYS